MDEELKSNISAPDTWLRLLLIIIFAAVTSVVVMPVVWLLAGVQFLFSLITGSTNDNLDSVLRSLVSWLHQVFAYMLYVSDEKPFPFSDLPATDVDVYSAHKGRRRSASSHSSSSTKRSVVKSSPSATTDEEQPTD